MSLDVMANAREQFLALVAEIRPELHRYCARLTGSVIDGEDIVQDALAKGFYALSMVTEIPPLRAWLFRIAHNAAIDYLRSHGKRFTDPSDELDTITPGTPELAADPSIMRAALARFVALPVSQRSAVILKDVLGFSLEEVAEAMATTVPAVKASLVRGRTRLRDAGDEMLAVDAAAKAQLDNYAALFNARDWPGVRAMVSEECRLDLVSKSQRRGKTVRDYFARYERESVRLATVRLEGQLALAAFVGDATAPSYFILLELSEGKVETIRDFRYIPYIVTEAVYELI